jgi:hypothetical protein
MSSKVKSMTNQEKIATLTKAAQWGQTELSMLIPFLDGVYKEAAIGAAKAIKDAIEEATDCASIQST